MGRVVKKQPKGHEMHFAEIMAFGFGFMMALVDGAPNWCRLIGGGLMLIAFALAEEEILQNGEANEEETETVETHSRE